MKASMLTRDQSSLRQKPTQPWSPVFPHLPPSLLHATVLIMCFSRCTSRFGKYVSVSSLGFLALLAAVQALCSLANQILELHRLDGIGVPHQVFLSTRYSLALMEVLAVSAKG